MLPDLQRIQRDTIHDDPTSPTVDSSWNFRSAFSGGTGTWILRAPGITLAIAGGIALGYFATAPATGSALGYWWTLLALVLWGALLALLLRSWSAIFVLPIVFSIGLFLGTVIEGGGFNLQTWLPTAAEAAFLVVIFCDLPLMLGIALGTPLGKRIEQRLDH
jgi:hypothetical protein